MSRRDFGNKTSLRSGGIVLENDGLVYDITFDANVHRTRARSAVGGATMRRLDALVETTQMRAVQERSLGVEELHLARYFLSNAVCDQMQLIVH